MADTSFHLVDRVLPDVALRQFVLSPPFELRGLLAVKGDVLSKMIQIFTEEVFGQMKRWAKTDGLEEPQCGGVSFIQRFTKTLMISPHLHCIILDGVFAKNEATGEVVFHSCPAPTNRDLLELGKSVFQRMQRYLQKEGYLDGDDDNEPSALDRWFLRSLHEPSLLTPTHTFDLKKSGVQFGGFSIHAGVAVSRNDQEGRLKLCRYVARPPLADEQLRRLDDGRIELTLRTPAKNGQRKILLEPLRLLRRLCWLVPPPRQNQVRYHGVLAARSKLRSEVVPRPEPELQLAFPIQNMLPEKKSYRVAWAILLKRVYDVDALLCPSCAARLRPVGAVLSPTKATAQIHMPSSARDPPQLELFSSA
jgi:Putative transposase